MKLLIAVATAHTYRYSGYHADAPAGMRANLIRETWKTLVPAGVDFKFFYGRGEGTPKEDEVFLDVPDAFFAMPQKVQAIFKYAVENNYDHVFECTDDVFINVPLALTSNFAQYDYVGNALNLGNSKVPFKFCSGFAVWYSRRAMELVVKAKCADYEKEFNLEQYRSSDNVGKVRWHDDLWVGSILSVNGIDPHNDERFLIEVCSDIGNGPPSTYSKDKAVAIHVSPRLELMRELMPKPFKGSNISCVLTSCNRHSLLRLTLDTFIKEADLPMDETIIVEDSIQPRPAWLTENYSPKLGKIVWLQNKKRTGQIFSLDRAYSQVKTDFIMHLEDDWRFMRGGFLAKSKKILEKFPNVSMIALSDLPRGPAPQQEHFLCGMGLSFNPGLRRTADYHKLGGYAKYCSAPVPETEILRRKAEFDRKACTYVSPETEVAKAYAALGMVVGHLGQYYVLHTGDFQSTFQESLLTKVSIVITTFNRPHQLRATLNSINAQGFKNLEILVIDDGTDEETPSVCKDFGALYIKVNRPVSTTYRNPALPNNIGIRHATGDIIILQNAECKHVDPATIQKLSGAVTDKNAVFAKVVSLRQQGTPSGTLYCGPQTPRPFFFCGAIKRAWFEKLRGFDQDFVTAGYDDNDFADRLAKEGVSFVFSDVEVHHQWHPRGPGAEDFAVSAALYDQKRARMTAGTLGTVRNLDRDWGHYDASEIQSTPAPVPVTAPVKRRSLAVPYAADGCTQNWWDRHRK